VVWWQGPHAAKEVRVVGDDDAPFPGRHHLVSLRAEHRGHPVPSDVATVAADGAHAPRLPPVLDEVDAEAAQLTYNPRRVRRGRAAQADDHGQVRCADLCEVRAA
jgi:hypothetical protein